jgi:hypothetical protein
MGGVSAVLYRLLYRLLYQGMSFAWYDVPLQDMDARVKLVRASGVLRTARVKNEGKDGEAYGDSPGGATGPAQLWECVNLIVGRDNLGCRPRAPWVGQEGQREVAL